AAQVVRRRRTRASTPPPIAHTARTSGSSRPRPPPFEEPVRAFASELAGDALLPELGAGGCGVVRVPVPGLLWLGPLAGAVAFASVAALRPAAPCRANARSVAGDSVPALPVPEPPAPVRI